MSADCQAAWIAAPDAWVCDGSACAVPPPLFVLLFCFDTGLHIAQAILQLTYIAKDGSDHPAPTS